ncbi:unsaturated rhamnogalacturonyl hydrolase YesR [Clostridia bacterium]|nr:unsaturated rhamnogalacturonyl hydrolase YesR [Clostridia bacterium]
MIRLNIEQNEALSCLTRLANKTMTMDEPWGWPTGVAYYGLSQAYKVTHEAAYLDFMKERVDELLELGLNQQDWNVNQCAMGHCLLTLAEETGDKRYDDVISDMLEYLAKRALRFGEATLQHTVSDKNNFPEQAWADTLFMAAFFMLRAGSVRKDAALIEDALNQYAAHIHYLQNPANGLWYHGYNNITKDHMSGFYWARANAWAAVTMSQVGRNLNEPYLYPQFMTVQGALRDQLAGIKLLQTENGLWRTILDDAESYEELSASCGIAAAMLSSGNPLHTKYIQRAYDGIVKNVSPDGRLLNVSGGTAVMRDLDGYRKIAKDFVQGYGQGLGMVFFAEILNTKRAA